MRLLLLILSFVTTAHAGELRVVSYNIHAGRGMDGKVDLKRIAEVIRREKPDLVALQEVDKFVSRSGNVDIAKELATLLGMHHAFGKTIDLGRGEYGNAVLSRFPIDKSTIHRLPGEGEARAVLQVDVMIGGKPLTFCSTHFDHRSGETRQIQAKAMDEALLAIGHPLIVAGDFNARPGSDTMERIATSWHLVKKLGSPLTSPASEPRAEIDYIITRNLPTEKSTSKVVEEKVASDHRPVSATIRLP